MNDNYPKRQSSATTWNEEDTFRKFVVPKLHHEGGDNEPHSITELGTFTGGRNVIRSNKTERRKPKRAGYLLRYTRDFPITFIEAKAECKKAVDEMQQAKEYAEILDLKVAYATNDKEIIEFDIITGIERIIDGIPSTGELWFHPRSADKLIDEADAYLLLTPANLTCSKAPRYCQSIAIDRAVHAVLQGRKCVLLTMVNGTDKTDVASQICLMLWLSKWNAKEDPTRKPHILFLADRNFLVNNPKENTFAAFSNARHEIAGGPVVHSRELYFAMYQSIAKDERRPDHHKDFSPDFFDLIIVDECHRGSAKEDSNKREILDYFSPSYHLGMNATPSTNCKRFCMQLNFSVAWKS